LHHRHWVHEMHSDNLSWSFSWRCDFRDRDWTCVGGEDGIRWCDLVQLRKQRKFQRRIFTGCLWERERENFHLFSSFFLSSSSYLNHKITCRKIAKFRCESQAWHNFI
jgi:hypothetical protein